MSPLTVKDNIQELIFIIVLSLVMFFFPPLIFPALIVLFFYFLSKTMKQQRSIGVSIFRTIYALLGIITFPLLYFGPQAYVTLQLSYRDQIRVEESPFLFFLILYRIFFMIIFPVLSYLSAYLLTIMDVGGCVLPVILLSASIVVMLIASMISASLATPFLIVVYAALLIAHIFFFTRKPVRAQFDMRGRFLGLEIFHNLYAIVGFSSLYISWYSLENMQYFSTLSKISLEPNHLLLIIVFGILCLLSSSLLFRFNIWGYWLPIFMLALAILLGMVPFYLPLLLAHIVFFNNSKVKLEFSKHKS